jgi:hypothetical protein
MRELSKQDGTTHSPSDLVASDEERHHHHGGMEFEYLPFFLMHA